MNKTLRLIVALAGISSAVAFGGQLAQADEGKDCAHWQGKGDYGCNCHHRGHQFHRDFKKMATELGLTDQQKAQIKEIFKKERAEMKPIMTRMIAERRNLRELAQADKIDEAAIRAQAAKLATIEGDLAIQHARVAAQIRAILTPAQVEKFKALQKERDKMLDKRHERMRKRFENMTTSK